MNLSRYIEYNNPPYSQVLDSTGTFPQVRKLNDGNCCHAEAEGGSDVRVAPAQYCANLFLIFF